MAARILVEGEPDHRKYQMITWGIGILLVILIAFAYVDTGFIEVGGNKYNLSMIIKYQFL